MREDQLDNADQNFYTTAGYLLAIFECSEKLFEVASIDEKREIVSLLLSNLRLDGKNFTFNLKEPFATLISQSKGSSWLGLEFLKITFSQQEDDPLVDIEEIQELLMRRVVMNDSKLFDNNTFFKTFECDLRRARQSVIIESPFITNRRMEHLLPILIRLRRKGVRIVVNTRSPEEHNEEYAVQAEEAVAAMQNIGVKVLYTVKHHRKLAIIDDDILWEGSLNILSQGDSCEIMRRTRSNELASTMINFIGVYRWQG